jgi:hypothetical protein
MGFEAVETEVGGPIAGEEVVMFFDRVIAVSCFVVGRHCVLDWDRLLYFTLFLFGYLVR